jgi:5-methylcytosine-specific restriction endonuclease McrA
VSTVPKEVTEARRVLLAAGLKDCTICGEIKSIEDFYKNRNTRDGLQPYCKSCNSKREVERQRQNAERTREIHMESYYRRIEKIRQYRIETREEHYVRNSIWRENNPEAYREMGRRANARRRAALAQVEYDVTVSLEELYVRDGGICGICDEECDYSQASIDHVFPISKGGPHVWDNVQLAHRSCNSRKGASVPEGGTYLLEGTEAGGDHDGSGASESSRAHNASDQSGVSSSPLGDHPPHHHHVDFQALEQELSAIGAGAK